MQSLTENTEKSFKLGEFAVVLKAIKALTQRTALRRTVVCSFRQAQGRQDRQYWPAGRPLTSPLDKLGASSNACLKPWTLD